MRETITPISVRMQSTTKEKVRLVNSKYVIVHRWTSTNVLAQILMKQSPIVQTMPCYDEQTAKFLDSFGLKISYHMQ